jgi:hypothetical protein
MVMTRNQIKKVEQANEGPRTRSKAATLEKWSVEWSADEIMAAKTLVNMKYSTVEVSRPRRSCAKY